jgi:hypothetical protein
VDKVEFLNSIHSPCLTIYAEIVAEVLNVIAKVGKVQVRLLLMLLYLLLELLGLLLGLLLDLLLELLHLLLHLLLELLKLLHNSIALSNRRKIGKISQLVGSLLESGVSLLESLREEREIRLRTELRHRLRRIDDCHGFESWEYDSGR